MKIYDLNSIIFSDKKYNRIKKALTELINNDIDKRKEEVNVIIDGEEYSMNKGNFLTLLILCHPFNKHKKEFPESLMIDPSNLSEYEEYFDNIIEYFIDNYDIKINDSLVDIINELTFVSANVNLKYGSTISLKSIIDLEKRNEEFRKLLHTKIEDNSNLTLDQIVKLTNENNEKAIKIIESDEDNILHNYLLSGAGINKKQLGQVLVYVGLKPDFNGNIIQYPINTSFCRGLTSVRELFINHVGARLALQRTHYETKKSGYLTRKIALLNIDEDINDVDDCGTSQTIEVNIKNNFILKLLDKRWFENDNNELELIDKRNKDLIGKKIKLRTPLTCACKKGICHTCYGELYKVNKDMNIGIIACLLITNIITQGMLSAKHLLQALIYAIDWSENFLKYFDIIDNQIIPKDKFDIVIQNEDIVDSDDNEERIIIDRFTIVTKNGDEIEIISPINLSINDDLVKENNIFNENIDEYIIENKVIKNYDYLFENIIENNGLTNSLYKLKDLLERNKFIKDHSIEEIFEYFADIMNESNMNVNLIHAEVILKQMMFIKDRSEFLYKFPEYTMYNISDAIQFGSDNVIKNLVFEKINEQLTTDKYGTFDKKGFSILEELM